MKASIALALLVALQAGPALADFVGPVAPAKFSISNSGTLGGVPGSAVPGTATFSATNLVMVGSNATSTDEANFVPACQGAQYSVLSGCELDVMVSPISGTFTFDWAYLTADSGGPAGDIFGVIVDGAHISLSDLGGAIGQSGHSTYVATSSFGWFINCTDCIEGAATATVTNVGFVPEPSSLALILAAGIGAGAVRRWRGLRRA
jgi:hypothetical protein